MLVINHNKKRRKQLIWYSNLFYDPLYYLILVPYSSSTIVQIIPDPLKDRDREKSFMYDFDLLITVIDKHFLFPRCVIMLCDGWLIKRFHVLGMKDNYMFGWYSIKWIGHKGRNMSDVSLLLRVQWNCNCAKCSLMNTKILEYLN